jgi:hypothetical protein
MFLRLVQFATESRDADLLYLLRTQLLVRLGDPRHRSLLTGAYRHLTVNAIADERQGDLTQTRLRLEEAQRVLAKRIDGLMHRLQQEEERWCEERAQLEPMIEELQAKLSDLEERERQRVASIDRGIKEEGDRRAAAKNQLAPLVAQQEDLERRLRWWQGDLHGQTLSGERALRQANWRQCSNNWLSFREEGRSGGSWPGSSINWMWRLRSKQSWPERKIWTRPTRPAPISPGTSTKTVWLKSGHR